MLNLKLGTSRDIDGHPWIATPGGRAGFALYGPYEVLLPGDHAAVFQLMLTEAADSPKGDPRCVALDIASDGGDTQLARRWVHVSQLTQGRTTFAVPFTLEAPKRLEFRAWVSGDVPLLIADLPRVIPAKPDEDSEMLADQTRFPGPEAEQVPFFRAHRDLLRRMFHEGTWVRIQEDRVVLRVAHVSLFCDSLDDLNFVGEVFHEGAYNFKAPGPVCVIDIGMNIGLSALQFAGKPEVRRVHAFEPFRNTFDRAMDNLRLNPRLASRITAHNVGLSDRDLEDTLRLLPAADSGSANVIERDDGQPVHIALRDAGALLAPVIAEARAAGETVIVKVDCEGSEFAVFESLARHGLIGQIGAFMVEWHAIFEDRTQETLIAPLREAGFLVFDRSPPKGNGFFYAVRMA